MEETTAERGDIRGDNSQTPSRIYGNGESPVSRSVTGLCALKEIARGAIIKEAHGRPLRGSLEASVRGTDDAPLER